ncbi:MAG: GTPase HflX [Candidatus Cloacimonetes bacterium]|nr:GTPase HflX [Candidatus Cloacimonadota bacterium]
MSKSITISAKIERAFLIGVHPKYQSKEEYEYSMSELHQLSETAGIEVVETFVQALERRDNATLVGKGKLEEINSQIEINNITTLIFNDNLSPSQARNIAEKTKCNIVDRTELILDIFAKHAQTAESKLQVELAQLEYSYSKLRHLWHHFSRIAGGSAVGVRGPGETQIEIDRRLVRNRISMLKEKLENIKKTTETKRKKRANQISICLVGYTNAGKSTLFNVLTKESIYTADKLFATLDSTTRAFQCIVSNNEDANDSYSSSSHESLMLTDTIGFIENLPPTLIQSFYSTLHEVREADLLLHVVDINNPKKEDHIETVDKILKEIKADDKDVILVFNKCDTFYSLMDKFQKKDLKNSYVDCIFISAKTGENLDDLKKCVKKYLSHRKTKKKFIIPAIAENIVSFLHNYTDIQSIDYVQEEHIYVCETLIDRKLIKNVEEQIEKSNLQILLEKED